jgi:hypothetical protein
MSVETMDDSLKANFFKFLNACFVPLAPMLETDQELFNDLGSVSLVAQFNSAPSKDHDLRLLQYCLSYSILLAEESSINDIFSSYKGRISDMDLKESLSRLERLLLFRIRADPSDLSSWLLIGFRKLHSCNILRYTDKDVVSHLLTLEGKVSKTSRRKDEADIIQAAQLPWDLESSKQLIENIMQYFQPLIQAQQVFRMFLELDGLFPMDSDVLRSALETLLMVLLRILSLFEIPLGEGCDSLQMVSHIFDHESILEETTIVLDKLANLDSSHWIYPALKALHAFRHLEVSPKSIIDALALAQSKAPESVFDVSFIMNCLKLHYWSVLKLGNETFESSRLLDLQAVVPIHSAANEDLSMPPPLEPPLEGSVDRSVSDSSKRESDPLDVLVKQFFQDITLRSIALGFCHCLEEDAEFGAASLQ